MGNFISRSIDRFTGRSGSQAASSAAGAQKTALDESIAELRGDFTRRQDELAPLRGFGQEQFDIARQLQDAGFSQTDIASALQEFGVGQQEFGVGQQEFGVGQQEFGFGEQQFGQQFREGGVGRQDIGFSQLDELAGAGTPQGFAQRLQQLKTTPGFQSLIDDRQQDAANQLQQLGLGRSTERIRSLGDIEFETLAGIESQLFGRQQGLAGFNVGAGGQNIDRAGNIIGQGTGIVGQGTGVIGQGTATAGQGTGAIGTGTNVLNVGTGIVGRGTDIGATGANIFQGGVAPSTSPQVAQFLRDKGIAEAGGILGSEQAKAQGASNIFNLGKKLNIPGLGSL